MAGNARGGQGDGLRPGIGFVGDAGFALFEYFVHQTSRGVDGGEKGLSHAAPDATGGQRLNDVVDRDEGSLLVIDVREGQGLVFRAFC